MEDDIKSAGQLLKNMNENGQEITIIGIDLTREEIDWYGLEKNITKLFKDSNIIKSLTDMISK